MSMVGTSGSPCGIQAISGQSWKFYDGGSSSIAITTGTFTYCNFTRMATAGSSGLQPYTAAYIAFSHCTFTGCGTMSLSTSRTDISVTFDDCTWTAGTLQTSGSLSMGLTGAIGSGTRRIRRCVFDDTCTYISLGFSIENNAFLGGKGWNGSVASTYSTALFRGNFMYGNGLANSSNGCPIVGNADRNYFVINNGIGNPHYIAPSALLGADATIQQNVFESQSPNAVDAGDCCIFNGSCTSGGNKVVLKNNIVAIGKYNETSGALVTIYSNATTPLLQAMRNTGNVNNHSVNPQGMFDIAEAGNGAAGQVSELKSNIAHGTSSSQGWLAERIGGTVKDIITAAGADYNWCYNTSAGDNLKGYEDKAAANTLWTAGDAVAAGVDAHQGTSNPAFMDATRTSVAWVVARGYGTTFADVLTTVAANTARIYDLIDYIFEGHKPSAAGCRAAAHDGACVGAANWHDTTRNLTRATALYSNLTTNWLT